MTAESRAGAQRPATERAWDAFANVRVLIGRASAVVLALAVFWLTFDRPFGREVVAMLLAASLVAQLRFPDAWLVVVPAALPVFDLTLWTGRIYLTEFDLLVLTAVAAHLWQAPPGYRLPRLGNRRAVLIAVVALAFLPSLIIGLGPAPVVAPSDFANYLGEYNALRVAKGMAWALLLLPALQWRLATDAQKVAHLFILGVSVGLAAVGMIVLWERGVLLEIVHWRNIYAVAGALLDFSTTYRATALFSELHTGGVAIDTYLVLAVPFALAGTLVIRRLPYRLVCLCALGLGTYAVMATFSRGLYAGYAVGVFTVLALAIAANRHAIAIHGGALGKACFTAVAASIAVGVAYTHGGFEALAIGILFSAAGLAVGYAGRRRPWSFGALGAGVGALICGYALFRIFLESRYVSVDPGTAIVLAAVCGTALVGPTMLLAGRAVRPETRAVAGIAFLCLAVVWAIAIPATGGYRMLTRFAAAEGDLQTREAHWLEALRIMESDPLHRAFGMGLGSFPREYFWNGIGTETKASYRFGGDDAGSWLELGTGDFNLTQKVPVRPNTDYDLSLAIRGEGSAGLSFKLCPKLILFSDRWQPQCLQHTFKPEADGGWTRHAWSFNSGSLGSAGLLGWPVTILLHNRSGDETVQVTDIQLSDGGRNIVANGDFEAGGDRWIMISDFEHLAWHVKNLYLHLFFENGAVGLVAFAAALGVAFVATAREARPGAALGPAIGGALVGFAVVGAVGSMIDNPRPATLFFLVLFWALSPGVSPIAERQVRGRARGRPSPARLRTSQRPAKPAIIMTNGAGSGTATGDEEKSAVMKSLDTLPSGLNQ